VTYFPRVLKYLKPYWRLAVVSGVLIVLGALAGLLAPWPLQILIDNVLGDHPTSAVLANLLGPLAEDRDNRVGLMLFAIIGGVFVTLLQHGLTVLDHYVNTKIDQNMVLDFRSDMFQHAQRLSFSFHDQRRSGRLIYKINNQGDAVARLIMAIPPLIQSVLTLIGMFVILLMIHWQMALLSLVVVPFLYYSVGYYVKHIHHRLQEVRRMEAESLSIIHEAISMLRVIVAFGRENHEHHRFRSQGDKTVDARVKLTVRQTFFSLVVDMITAIGTALVLGVGAYMALSGQLTAGQLLVVMAYLALVYKPLETISTTVGSFQVIFVALRSSFNLLDKVPEIKDDPEAISIDRARGAIEFQGVHFNYQTRTNTLQDISFTAQPGQVIAIVGPTGAGKTTLISLIPRFYDVKKGGVLLDGHDVRRLTVKSLRDQISIVLQEPLLFSGSVRDNIRYGRLDATMEEIMAAAQAANAHDFIMRLPKQYDTELGERGAQVSGGERQRISVARAFLKNAPILLLDEPTSSIDSKTEPVILDALDRLMVGRTTFMIAHRLSTIRRADLILVLDHGRLVERGTHEELLECGGLYKQLYDMQTRQRGRRLLPELEMFPDGITGGRA